MLGRRPAQLWSCFVPLVRLRSDSVVFEHVPRATSLPRLIPGSTWNVNLSWCEPGDPLESAGRFLVKHVTATNSSTGDLVEYDERLRLYNREELLTMFDSVDLGVSGVFGDYDRGEFFKNESERIILICEKQTGTIGRSAAGSVR